MQGRHTHTHRGRQTERQMDGWMDGYTHTHTHSARLGTAAALRVGRPRGLPGVAAKLFSCAARALTFLVVSLPTRRIHPSFPAYLAPLTASLLPPPPPPPPPPPLPPRSGTYDHTPTQAPDKKNQDSFCVQTNFGGDLEQMFFGVFDGHGENGTQCSQFTRRRVSSSNPPPPPPPGPPARPTVRPPPSMCKYACSQPCPLAPPGGPLVAFVAYPPCSGPRGGLTLLFVASPSCRRTL